MIQMKSKIKRVKKHKYLRGLLMENCPRCCIKLDDLGQRYQTLLKTILFRFRASFFWIRGAENWTFWGQLLQFFFDFKMCSLNGHLVISVRPQLCNQLATSKENSKMMINVFYCLVLFFTLQVFWSSPPSCQLCRKLYNSENWEYLKKQSHLATKKKASWKNTENKQRWNWRL